MNNILKSYFRKNGKPNTQAALIIGINHHITVYGSAYLYEGKLLDPLKITRHIDSGSEIVEYRYDGVLLECHTLIVF